jgi:hypothetical protein
MRGYSLAGGNAGALNSTLGPMLDTQGQCFCVYAYPQHPCNARGKKEHKLCATMSAHSSYKKVDLALLTRAGGPRQG